MQEDIKPSVPSVSEDKRSSSDTEDVLPLTIKKEPNSGDEIKVFVV